MISNTTTAILFGAFLYTIIGTALHLRDDLPTNLNIVGPITTIRTERGKDWLNRTANRFPVGWIHYGNLGVASAIFVMIIGSLLVTGTAIFRAIHPQPDSPITDPVNMLVIPGVNDFLPASVATEIVLGLLIGLVVHEAGHGIYCRVGDIRVKSVGVACATILPIGAFVEPDEVSQDEASRGARLRMFAAGVTNNFVLSAILLAVLLGPIAWSITTVSGAAVAGAVPQSPGAEAGLEKGSVVTAVNGTPVESNTEYQTALMNQTGATVTMTLQNGSTVELSRSVFVTQAVGDANLTPGETITHVNDTRVTTPREFYAAIQNRTVAKLTTAAGNTTTVPIGAFVVPQQDTAISQSGAPVGEPLVITHINDSRVYTGSGLSEVLDSKAPGDTVTVTGYQGESRVTYSVKLGEQSDGSSFLGVSVAPGVSGVQVDDDGVRLYPAERYLSLLQSGPAPDSNQLTATGSHLLTLLQFPAAQYNGVLPYNFAGFTGGVQHFYTVTGPLAGLGSAVVFFVANLLFWVAWVNINLGIFNCLPTYPLDGGHIIADVSKTMAGWLPISEAHQQSLAWGASRLVMVGTLAAIYVMVFGVPV